jgi:hypothetical protein
VKTAILLFIAAVAAIAVGSAAPARVGDAQWAACVWQTDAKAASNWLKLKPPLWQDKFGSPAELLGYRLIASCDATPADPKKPNRLPKWTAMQQQLKRSRPKDVPASTAARVTARLCEYYATKGEERALYLVEAIRVEGSASTTVHQVYFGQAGTNAVRVVDYAGRPVSFQFGGSPGANSPIRMPQDTLIASPSEGYVSEKVCRAIAADGTLTDA